MEEEARIEAKLIRPINLWDLKAGDKFMFEDQQDVELEFLGMDGMYAKVRALDPELNKKMCAQYDAHSNFFAIMTHGCVIKLQK